MKLTHPRWFALIALSAIACRAHTPADTAVRTTAHTDPKPVADSAQSSSIALTPVMPTIPAQSEVVPTAVATVGSRAERLSALESEYEKTMDAFYDLYRNAKSDEERQTIAETVKPPDPKPFEERARALIAEDATDTTAFGALKWLLMNSRGEDTKASDVALLERHHFERPEMVDILSPLQYASDPHSAALLERLAEKSPHRTVRGRAWMARADAVKESVSMSTYARELTAGKERDEFVESVGQAEFDRLVKLDPRIAEARVMEIYERVSSEYADVPASRKGTIGDQAKGALFEMRSLVVGKTAPEIAGEDLAGVAFKLSDYRGKVVMLDFWGNW